MNVVNLWLHPAGGFFCPVPFVVGGAEALVHAVAQMPCAVGARAHRAGPTPASILLCSPSKVYCKLHLVCMCCSPLRLAPVCVGGGDLLCYSSGAPDAEACRLHLLNSTMVCFAASTMVLAITCVAAYVQPQQRTNTAFLADEMTNRDVGLTSSCPDSSVCPRPDICLSTCILLASCRRLIGWQCNGLSVISHYAQSTRVTSCSSASLTSNSG